VRQEGQEADGRYTFGDGDAAERRLEEIATFFNRAAEGFLRRCIGIEPGLVADLGCGPGFTTEMLARLFGAPRLVGLDLSNDFLQRARRRLPACRFKRHDVRSPPFPVRPDLAYCRFLLSHLSEAPALVDPWTRALAPGGWLILDELEAIETDVPVLRRYLEISARLVASQGADLWVGRALCDTPYASPVLLSATERLTVPNARAASWFHPNTVTVWRREPSVARWLDEGERREIAATLARMRDSGEPCGQAVWIMRRMIVARPEHD